MANIIKKEDLDENNIFKTDTLNVQFPPMEAGQDSWVVEAMEQITEDQHEQWRKERLKMMKKGGGTWVINYEQNNNPAF